MSDTTSPPLDIGSPTDPSATPPTDADPTATNPTDPNATNASDPNAGAGDPNAGATDPIAGAGDPNTGIPADPNSSTPTSVIDSDAGSPQTTGNLPSAIPGASLGQSTSVTAVPTPSSSGIAGSDRDNGGAVVAFDGKNAQYRKAIIIASAVSGAVGLILVVAVIFVVYRRRNRRNRNNATFVNAAVPRPKPARPASDATWIGTRLEDGSDGSFDVGKLEAGSRTSEAGSIDSDTTLADFAAARAKSGAFSTPTHSPRPSLEKIKVANMPMVPEDPFEAPVLSMADRPRPSLEQMINPVPQSAPTPRRRKSAPHMRINSNSSYTGEVVIEQGIDNGVRSPGFMIPLVTPMEPPANWRAQSDDDFIPPPPLRGSMIPLSRQSSRASSRNSRDLDAEVISPSKKSVFTAIAKKRRSRADSIDPFRKSAASMAARRKSRAESIASRNAPYASSGAVRRKSRAESVAAPKSPGGRRKSRAGSIRRVQPANPIFDPTQDMGYSVSAAQQVPRTPIGLPKTPRTPTAARQSRVMNGSEPRTPRTARGPLPLPPTPRTSGIQQPRTPGIERPRTPVERARTPGIERPRTPGTERPRTPGAQQPRTPVTAREPRTPRTAQDPRTPGSRTRTPKAVVPRTPTSLDDAHWDSVPLALPAPVARPPPSAPLPGGRAELRMSQLSRALSEVSRDSPI
ncbi:hypothetical protein OH76DRAFT_193623 [Lentinus brumalis]|uniref:Uncharacterized protein n=1 Tax=Lentinus brumalis TaxID=2498619 RepID=A0A371CMX8_9APHY|nr:hypothetical protein OH76DRAFT_193623 [Polyporus brumalis]